MLGTEAAMWQQWREHNRDDRELPAIVPVVVYHGARPWRAATELSELYALPAQARAALGEPLTRCRFLLDDLSTIEDEAIRTRHMNAVARLALFALRRSAAPDFFERLITRWLDELNEALSGAFRQQGAMVLMYTFRVNRHVDPEIAMSMILPMMEPEAKETAMSMADKLMQRGFAQGLERGREEGLERGFAQGVERGQRTVLLRQLEKRFGQLPAHVSERVARASGPDLERWADRVLDATELDAVFSR